MKRQRSFIDVPFGKHTSNSQTGNDLSTNKRHQILLGRSTVNSAFRTIASSLTQTMKGMSTDDRRQPLGDISNNTPSNKIFNLCTSSKSMTNTLIDKNTTLLVDSSTHATQKTTTDATTCNKRKKRGPTRLEHLRDLKLPIKVELNEFGQPIGGKNQPIAYSIGILVKEANLVPLDTLDIRNMSEQKKLAFWAALLETYDLDVSRAEKWVDECKSARFRSFKSQLKSTYYENRISDGDCIRHPPPRIDPTQWANLVKYWGTDEAQEKVDQARENRGMVKMMHTAGTKSYAKRRAEYIDLNIKKNVIPEEERSRESLDQIYEVVVGPRNGDRVNGYGIGVTKSLLRGTARSSSSTQVIKLEKIVDSLKVSLEAQVGAHARALEEQAMSHARVIEEQTCVQEKLNASLKDLKSIFFLMAGKIETGSK